MPGRLLLGFRRSSPASSTVSLVSKESDDRSLSSNSSARGSIEQHIMDIKRHSIGKHHHHHAHSDKKGSPKMEPVKSAHMSMITESPPLVLYGSMQNSTGALFSGQLFLDVKEPSLAIEKFEMQFLCTTTPKKPTVQNCPDCSSQTTELKKWDFLNGPLRLTQGGHSFPFSYLVPGNLPATTHGCLGVINYHLAAEAVTSTGEVITFGKSVEVKRAIIPGNDKHSVRIFPPTNLTAQCTLPSVIHPIGEFGLEMRLAGITTKQKDAQVRWRLRKLVWRIEEHQKMVSPVCAKHAAKFGTDGKGMTHEDTRIIGQDEIKSGWKSDFNEGTIEVEFRASANHSLKPICNVNAANGLTVTHNLVVEMVVAEEWVPNKRPTQITPTGAARVLRTQFQLVLTERGGLGISWDEEQPPMYEDVPASPPTYNQVEDSTLHILGDDIEHFHLG